ncbi:hypothetical protein ACIBQ1_35535 [Nonomuraea sp. NPDC050153]
MVAAGDVARFAKDGVLVGAVAANSHKDLIRIKRTLVTADPLDALP